MRFINPSITIGWCAATILFAANLWARDSQPPPSLPEPAWVSMVDQRGADERLAGYLAPRELKLEIVAESPVITHAADVCFGTDGSLFILEWMPAAEASAKEVVESVTYRDGAKRSFTRMSTPVKDVVRIVPDLNSKNALEQAKVVLESERIACMLVHGDWLYVASSGSIQRYRRSKHDGPFDVKETIARGFDGVGSRRAFGLSFDFDDSLLIATGVGNHDVEGSDGTRAHVAGSGAIFRCRADGSHLELLALGLSRPSGGPAFDNEFYMFQLDGADAKAASKCRLLHIAEASDFGFRSLPGSRIPVNDRARQNCLQNLPGVMPQVLATVSGSSAGLCIYNDTRFPPLLQGLFLIPDATQRSVRALKAARRGSTFAITEGFDLVRSHDPGFQPWQVFAGPDGAIYLTDRPKQPLGGVQPSAPTREGRLYRMSWSGGPALPELPLRSLSSWSRFASQGGADLVKSLGAPDRSDRRYSQQELIRRGTLNKAALLEAVGNPELSVDARILAAGSVCAWWDDEVRNVLIKLATDDDAVLRRIAAECLGRNGSKRDPQIQEALLYVLGDADPATRRSVAMAMAKVAAPEAPDCLATALAFDIGGDVYLRDGLVRALERLGKPGLERLLALANSGEEDRLDLAVESFSALRSPLGIELLPQLLGHPHLRTEQKVRLVRSLARYELGHPKDFLPILHFFVKRPPREPELRTALREVLFVHFFRKLGGFVRLGFSLLPLST